MLGGDHSQIDFRHVLAVRHYGDGLMAFVGVHLGKSLEQFRARELHGRGLRVPLGPDHRARGVGMQYGPKAAIARVKCEMERGLRRGLSTSAPSSTVPSRPISTRASPVRALVPPGGGHEGAIFVDTEGQVAARGGGPAPSIEPLRDRAQSLGTVVAQKRARKLGA